MNFEHINVLKTRLTTGIVRNEKSAQRPKFSAGRPCGHPAKNFGQALQILEKTSILARTCRADVHEKTSV